MISKEKLYHRVPLLILSHLAQNPNTPLYGREIARKVGVSVGSVNQTLNYFLKANLVSREEKGRLYLYLPNIDNPIIRYFKIFENILKLDKLLNKIKRYCNKVILYGSRAEGLDTSGSDVDLFIQTEEAGKVREIIEAEKTLDYQIKPVILDRLELISVKKKDKAFYEQVTGGITLWEKEKEV